MVINDGMDEKEWIGLMNGLEGTFLGYCMNVFI